jgi:malate dehydrogenase
VDTVHSLVTPTPEGDWYSVGICSDGSYGVEPGIISSFPIRTAGAGREVVQGVTLNEFSREKINASVAELLEEKALVSELL